MANSHPGSYCGQDAYNDMLVTERHEHILNSENGSIQTVRQGFNHVGTGLQKCDRPDFNWGGVLRLKL